MISDNNKISRRKFLVISTFLITGFTMYKCSKKEPLSFGVLTDVHYADRDPANTRNYRDSLDEMKQAINMFNERNLDFIIELGDFIDKGQTVAVELDYLKKIEAEYAAFNGTRHYVLGNHDMATLSKKQFLAHTGARAAYYSFDVKSFHFVVLDACFRADGTPYNAGNFDWKDTFIPEEEIKWLKNDLQKSNKKSFIFVHQRLDDEGEHGVSNCKQIRIIFEDSGKVLMVLQGHDHNGDFNQINGIYYFTSQAMVEGAGLVNNAYSIMEITPELEIKMQNFEKQQLWEF